MTTGLKKILILTGYLETISFCNALKCWRCIAHDCDLDLEDNYKASKVKCQDGQMCMKVRYRMFDNVTHYDSVIRTCTDTTCDTSSMEDFISCISNPAKYMIGGCTLRSCCDDKDLCNSSRTIFPLLYVQILALCITFIPFNNYTINDVQT